MSVVTCPRCRARLTVTAELAEEGEALCPRCEATIPLDLPGALPAARTKRAGRAAPDAEPDEGSGKQVVRAGGCASVGGCLLIVLACAGVCVGWANYTQRARDDLAAADRLYAEGQRGEAVAKYKDRFAHLPNDRRAEVIRRVADHEAVSGDGAEARRWVEKGLDAKQDITYESPAARDLLARVQRERAEAEAKKQAETARKQAEAAKRKTEEEEQKKGMAVTADALRAAYSADPKAADAKYKGKTLRVTGDVNEYIAPEPGVRTEREPILSLQPNVEPWVWCYFSPVWDADVRRLRPGQRVTVRGKCDGIFVGQIKLTGCSLEP